MLEIVAVRFRLPWPYLVIVIEGTLIPEDTKADSFTEFVTTTEAQLRVALSAAHGLERGREAAAEALAYGWEHWDRIHMMENPAGYLYRVGQNRAKRMRTK